ncbi:MAG: ABC transporter permease [Actinomycetota bacterium]
MGRYIIRRLLLTIPVVLGAILLLYIATFVVPGDPVASIGGERATDPVTREVLRKKYNLDKPLVVQYVLYVKKMATGDLGESLRLRRSVTDILKEHLPWTVRLAVLAVILELVFGIAAGLLSAVRRYSFMDVLVTLSTSVLVSVPLFWLGAMLQIVFGVKLRWLPVAGVQAGWKSYVLPSITLAAISTAYVARIMRTTMLETMRTDYMRTATAKGLSERQVILRHGMRNSLIPVVTMVGIDFGALLGGAILTETVYSWPGIGRQIYLAVMAQDNQIVLGGVTFMVFVFIMMNLLVDILYAYLDPRIRYS